MTTSNEENELSSVFHEVKRRPSIDNNKGEYSSYSTMGACVSLNGSVKSFGTREGASVLTSDETIVRRGDGAQVIPRSKKVNEDSSSIGPTFITMATRELNGGDGVNNNGNSTETTICCRFFQRKAPSL